MDFLEIICLGLALAADVFGIAFAYGVIIKRHRQIMALRLSGTCGVMQFVMPLLGFNLNCCFKKIPEKYLQIIAGLVLIGLGLKNLLSHFI